MNPPDITTLLNMSESDSLDFKSGQYKFWNPSTDEEKSELLKDIIAFANSFKTGDAFIVVGVSEKNQRKDQVVGITTHLKDNEVQQFVNSKTNRRVAFLVHSSTAEGQPIDIIQIAQKQERPICLTKNYGKVKANEVWIRAGSSSATATPDQIAAMVKADQNASLGEARIAVEWAAAKTRTRLGLEVGLTGARLIEPPPPPPKPTPRPPTALERKIARLSPFEQFQFPQPQVARIVSIGHDTGPTAEELREYVQNRALFSPLRVWVKNLGARNASNVNVRIAIPKIDGVVVLDTRTLPKRPRGRGLLSALDLHTPRPLDTYVREVSGAWTVEIDAKTIQPQAEFWSYDHFYVASASDQTIEAIATIFADDLAKPLEVPLKIHAKVVEREIAPADFEATED